MEFIGEMNIDGEPVGRGLAPAVYRGFMINNRLFAAGASPRPTSKPIISPFAEHQFDRFKHTDKPKFEKITLFIYHHPRKAIS